MTNKILPSGEVANESLTVVKVYNLLTGLGVDLMFPFEFLILYFSFSWLILCAGLLPGEADGDFALDCNSGNGCCRLSAGVDGMDLILEERLNCFDELSCKENEHMLKWRALKILELQ